MRFWALVAMWVLVTLSRLRRARGRRVRLHVHARRNAAVTDVTLSKVVRAEEAVTSGTSWSGGAWSTAWGSAARVWRSPPHRAANRRRGGRAVRSQCRVAPRWAYWPSSPKAARRPLLELIAAAPAPEVGLGGSMPEAARPVYVGSWPAWIRGFNRSLTWDTASSYAATITRLSHDYAVDPRLVLAVVAAESAFSASAQSPVGAMGLGRLMPDTAASLGVRNAWDPEKTFTAVQLLHTHLQHYGSLPKVLAAYNAGPGAVDQYGGVPLMRKRRPT